MAVLDTRPRAVPCCTVRAGEPRPPPAPRRTAAPAASVPLSAVPPDDLPVSLELAAARPVRGRRALLLFAGWTLYGLVFAALWTATAKSELKPEHMLHQLGLSILPAWLWAACTPLVVRTTRRMSPARVGWVRAALAHVALALAIAFAVSAVRRLVNGIVMADMDYVTPFWVSFSFWIDHNLFTYAVVAGVVHSLDLHRR